jgi:hypothetical protein
VVRRAGYVEVVLRGILVVAALFVGLGSTVRAAEAASVAACAPSNEIKVHDEVVFGHFSTLTAAKAYRARAANLGFHTAKVEKEGCGDFEVEEDGADTAQQRNSAAAEAGNAHLQVTFEQTADPMAYRAGEVVGVLGKLSTVSAANALMWKLARVGFRYLDLAHQGRKWLVVMPQVPTKSALSIAHEVAAARFHIQFQPGRKP